MTSQQETSNGSDAVSDASVVAEGGSHNYANGPHNPHSADPALEDK